MHTRDTDTVLLERESECALLARLIAGATRGEGATVALEGVAGVGKSALIARAALFARDAGMTILVAHGGELERDFAYGVVRQLFEPPLAAAALAERERLLAGAAGLARAVVAPTEQGEEIRGDAGTVVLHGLYWLAANLAAERPLLVGVDDAHWCDAASLGFLRYLSRRVDELPILLVYAARPGEGSAQLLPGVAEHGDRDVALVTPSELSPQATGSLLGTLLGRAPTPELAHACHVATAGNPFLVHELARTLVADGVADDADAHERVARLAPTGVARATLHRLRRLGPTATRLAFAVAVLGATSGLPRAAALAQLDHEEAAAAADALASAAILTAGRPLRFVHPVVRTTVYAELPAARRALDHKRAALLLSADGVAPDALAPHLLAAEPAADPWVVERLADAARAALLRGAPQAACTYLQRALAEPPSPQARVGVLRALGSAEFRAMRTDAAQTLHAALQGAPDDAAGAAELALALAAEGRAPDGVALLEQFSARISAGDRDGALRLEALLAGMMQMELTTARQLHDRLARYEAGLAGETSAERLVLAILAAQGCFDASGTADQQAERAATALAGGRLLSEQDPDAQPFYMAVSALMFSGRFAAAAEMFGAAIVDARERGSLFGFVLASAGRSLARHRHGSLVDAEADGQAALEALRGGGGAGLMPIVVAYVLPTLIERAPAGTGEALVAATGTDGDLPEQTICNLLLHGRGRLRLAADDAQAALADFEELLARDGAWGMVNPSVWPSRSSTALAHLRLGRPAEARRLVAEELDVARRWGAPGAVACALRASALAGPGDDAVEILRESVRYAAASEARAEHAGSLTELGAALRRGGHPREAREPLREALDLAHRCGATRLAQRAREELRIAGAKPRRVVLSGLHALTASELRVARAAACGQANRDIAQELFVTVRTVEGHLTQAYRKLDISSREQLAEALGGAAAVS